MMSFGIAVSRKFAHSVLGKAVSEAIPDFSVDLLSNFLSDFFADFCEISRISEILFPIDMELERTFFW